MNKQQVIIFEGCDKVGKTEMAKELSKRIHIPYFKNKDEWSAFSNEEIQDYFVNSLKYAAPYFFNFLRETKTSVILDRSYPSEWVYSKVFKRKTDDKFLDIIDSAAAEINTKIIIPFRTSYTGFHDDIHDINSKQLEELSNMYEKFAKYTKCSVFRFCVDSEDLEYEMNEILNFLGE